MQALPLFPASIDANYDLKRIGYNQDAVYEGKRQPGHFGPDLFIDTGTKPILRAEEDTRKTRIRLPGCWAMQAEPDEQGGQLVRLHFLDYSHHSVLTSISTIDNEDLREEERQQGLLQAGLKRALRFNHTAPSTPLALTALLFAQLIADDKIDTATAIHTLSKMPFGLSHDDASQIIYKAVCYERFNKPNIASNEQEATAPTRPTNGGGRGFH